MTDKYSNGALAVFLSLGAILEALTYRVVFSVLNCLGWLLCTEAHVASTRLGLLIKDLFSGAGPLYTAVMFAWATFITVFSLFTALRVGGVSASDIFTVWGLERLHTWTWQYAVVAVVVFLAGRRREQFERERDFGRVLSTTPEHSCDPADSDEANESDGLIPVRETVSSALQKPPGTNDQQSWSLNWDELRWWANNDF
jgi:hypothetical protein